jgi:hypothetical protein
MDRLPPAKLYRASLPDCPRAPCLICGTPVRGDFQPIYCHHHRNNQTPISGWAFLLRSEVNMINILRENRWTDDALAELRVRGSQAQAQVARLADDMAATLTIEADPSTPPGSTEIIEIDDAL